MSEFLFCEVRTLILKSGISGFYLPDTIIPLTDEQEFVEICYSMANDNQCSVKKHHFVDIETNYFAVEIEVNDKTIVVLLNKHYPFVAFSKMKDGFISNFIDSPAFKRNLCEFYHVLSIEELMTPITLKTLQNSELNSAELNQIEYWKPNNIGEILFNHWD